MIKRSILTLVVTLGFVLGATAQDGGAVHSNSHEHDHSHEGRVFIGGALTYWNDTKEKAVDFDICPEIGYLFNDT